jgi:MerR family transcriptional regulator, light-induced transcriptional regulator
MRIAASPARRTGPDARVAPVSDDLPFKLPPVDPSAADVPAASLSPELLAGLLADGDDELAAWTLRHAMDESTRAEVYDGLLREAMRIVGERWKTGRWSVAEEHLASHTLLRTLERVRPEIGPEGRVGPLVVLASVEGEQHMIGLACLEQLLAEAGWTVVNLGADLPSSSLARFLDKNDAALVCLSAMDGMRVGAVADAVKAAKDVDPHLPVIVGGGIAGVVGLGPTVGADGTATSLADALALASHFAPRAPYASDAN